MATLSTYLFLADVAYQPKSEGRPDAVGGWRTQKWEWATWYGDGFQGGVFTGDDGEGEEVIVAFSGTKGSLRTAPISQQTANLRIGVHVIPNMAGSAFDMVRWAQVIYPELKLSIVGHSLGGGLAQVVGNWSGVPFISFNGPGMAGHLKASAFNIFKPKQMLRSIRSEATGSSQGISFAVRGDLIANYGKHVGTFVPLDHIGTTDDRHSLQAIRRAFNRRGWLTTRPQEISEAWPA
jgi:putative lipase involved disintegration of autophagic bodies